MTKIKMSSSVEHFINTETKWKDEFIKLRDILLDSEMKEEIKWGKPCYTINGKNVVLMHGFKDYCALLFIKGSLLKDDDKILVQQTENVQAGRQIRFTSTEQIDKLSKTIKKYIDEAIALEKTGAEIAYKKTDDCPIPPELVDKFADLPTLQKAFESLTPGRQRAYIYYFNQAKQSKTRTARIEKYVQKIFDGKGIND
ncbi:MAG: DUF1801 domain-containing protein [Eubacteriales bacterium]